MKKITCLNCEELFEGRANKKFCSNSCKNQYHNEKNKEKTEKLLDINKKLHRNWSLLNDMYNVYRSKPIDIEMLTAAGFEEKFHTHIYKSHVGGIYNFVYDYGWKPYIDNQIQIVKDDAV